MEPNQLRERSIITGSAAYCIDHLKKVQAAGLDEVICYFNFGGCRMRPPWPRWAVSRARCCPHLRQLPLSSN